MRRIGIAGAVICLLATNTMAAQVTFRGTIHFTALSQTCIVNGDGAVGDFAMMRFSPPNLGTNGAPTRISIFNDFGGAQNATLASGSLVGTTFKNVTTTGIYRGAGSGPATLRLTSQSPSSPTKTTASMTIAGDWTDFSGDTGCTISFIGTGLKQ